MSRVLFRRATYRHGLSTLLIVSLPSHSNRVEGCVDSKVLCTCLREWKGKNQEGMFTMLLSKMKAFFIALRRRSAGLGDGIVKLCI